MAVQLVKRGGKVDLTKKNPNLKVINVALGWDTNKYSTGGEFDLDVSAFVLQADGKCSTDDDVVFYNNPSHPSGSVTHSGDNRTGDADADDEVIKVDLTKVPSTVDKIAFVITIFDYQARNQNFGMVSNSYVRVDNAETNEALIKFDLDEDFSVETGVLVCELYRKNGEWKFNAVGQGYNNGLDQFVKNYGLDVQ
jgi:tellurium resistance protein TerD